MAHRKNIPSHEEGNTPPDFVIKSQLKTKPQGPLIRTEKAVYLVLIGTKLRDEEVI